jgi:hypothetical protein
MNIHKPTAGFTKWEAVIKAYPTPTSQAEADTAITVYLSSCEHDPGWIPTIEEWRIMLVRTRMCATSAGFLFDRESCIHALSGWFWRYHWRELDRELFKQYAIALAGHFGCDISAVMNRLWDEVVEDTESGDPAFKSTASLLRHLMNVSKIPGVRIHPSRESH